MGCMCHEALRLGTIVSGIDDISLCSDFSTRRKPDSGRNALIPSPKVQMISCFK